MYKSFVQSSFLYRFFHSFGTGCCNLYVLASLQTKDFIFQTQRSRVGKHFGCTRVLDCLHYLEVSQNKMQPCIQCFLLVIAKRVVFSNGIVTLKIILCEDMVVFFASLDSLGECAFVRGFLHLATCGSEHDAFVRGFRQIPRVKHVKTKFSCETSFKFRQLKI